MGGQGTAGQSCGGCGKRPVAQQPLDPGADLATSVMVRCSASSLAERAGELPGAARRASPPRPAAAARRPSPTAPCAACPRRGSTPRGPRRRSGRPAPTSTCPPLRSALLSTASKHRQPGQPRVVGVGQGVRARRRRPGPRRSGASRARQLVGGHEPDQRLGVVRLVDPQLAGRRGRAARRAARSAAPDPSRSPGTTRYADDLTAGERAVREVPQRPLAADRLVDAAGGHPVQGEDAAQRGVGGVDQPALELQLAVAQQPQRVASSSGEAACSVDGHRW